MWTDIESSVCHAGLMMDAAHIARSSEEEFLGDCLAPFLLDKSSASSVAPSATAVCVAFLQAVERCNRVDLVRTDISATP